MFGPGLDSYPHKLSGEDIGGGGDLCPHLTRSEVRCHRLRHIVEFCGNPFSIRIHDFNRVPESHRGVPEIAVADSEDDLQILLLRERGELSRLGGHQCARVHECHAGDAVRGSSDLCVGERDGGRGGLCLSGLQGCACYLRRALGVIQIFLGYGLLRVESARAGEFAVRLLKLSLRLVRRGACRFEICLERCLINDEKRLAASDEFAFLIKLPLQDAAHLRPDLHLIGTLGLPHHLMPLGNVFRSYRKRSDRHRLCRSLCVGLF